MSEPQYDADDMAISQMSDEIRDLRHALTQLYEIHVSVCRSAEIDPEGATAIYEKAMKL